MMRNCEIKTNKITYRKRKQLKKLNGSKSATNTIGNSGIKGKVRKNRPQIRVSSYTQAVGGHHRSGRTNLKNTSYIKVRKMKMKKEKKIIQRIHT